MNIVNETSLQAGWTMGFRPDGRELVVVALKETYVLLGPPGEPTPAEAPVPLFDADVFGPDPATTAPVFECDFAHTKPYCDVLLHGQAHAPEGRRVESLVVRMVVGPVQKSMVVHGARAWVGGPRVGLSVSGTARFVSQPISYDVAFGGTEKDPRDPDQFATFVENPVGRGFRRFDLHIEGMLLPTTEELNHPIRDPKARYRPMSFGPLGRSWRPRIGFAGTYDQRWLEERIPLWPQDFDTRYFQAAPPDQQMAYPNGGEPIQLWNLVPASVSHNPYVEARLPTRRVGVVFGRTKGTPSIVRANLDTVLIEPDENRFSCTWRAVEPANRDIFEFSDLVVGDLDGGLIGQARARAAGKTYVAGLGKLPVKGGPT